MRFPFFTMYWRRTLRKPGSIFLWMLLPFVFMTIYQLAFGGDSGGVPKTGLAVVDEDSSLVSRFVAGAFSQGQLADFLEVHPAANLDEVDRLFRDKDAAAALVIPQGFGDRILAVEETTLKLYTNPRLYITPLIAEGIVGTLVAMGNGLVSVFEQPLQVLDAYTSDGREPTADDVATIARVFYTIGENTPNIGAVTAIDVSVIEEKEEEDPFDAFGMAALFFPGLIMFGLLSVSLHLETRFLHDRLGKVTHRFVTTPVRPFSIVLQQRFYVATFLYLIAVVSGIVGGIVWQIPPVGLVTANLISIAVILFVTGLNGTIFSLSNSVRATSAISSAVMMVLLVVGGGFFPVESGGKVFQSIAMYVPTGMANLGLTRAVTGRDPGISIPILFIYCGAFFFMSIIMGRRRLT